MTEIAWLSGDYKALEPTKAVMGGVAYYREAIPSHGLSKYGAYDCHLGFHLRSAPDGAVETFDTMMEPHSPDVIVLHRWTAEGAESWVRRARACGQVVISDLDDNLFQTPKRIDAHHALDPTLNPHSNIDHLRRMLKASSAIFVSTSALAAEVRSLDCPTFVLPNAIDITAWQPNDPGNSLNPVVGWVGGVAWRGHDLPILKPWLGHWLEDRGATFYHGGHNPRPGRLTAWEEAGIDPDRVRVIANPMVQLNEYVRLWRDLDISLVPVERSAFGDSKSFLKGLESSAAGLPFIASDTPEYRKLGFGRLARNYKPVEWINHLEDLTSPAVRRAEGAANRKHAEQHDISVKWTQWDAAIKEALAA